MTNETKPNWWNVVQEVDRILDAQGEAIIQESPGHGGQTLYGYIPQAVIDAVNEVLGLDWDIFVEDHIISQSQKEGRHVATVRVRVVIRKPGTNEVWAVREAFGGSENYSPGDALKGAETDAIGKALSLFSIGHLAYRGELAPGAKEPKPEAPHEPKIKNPDDPPTEKQISLFRALLEEAKKMGILSDQQYQERVQKMDKGGYTKGTMSKGITWLKEHIEKAISEYEEENP